LGVKVQTRVAFASVQRARKRAGQFANEAVVRDAEVAELESKANQMGEAV